MSKVTELKAEIFDLIVGIKQLEDQKAEKLASLQQAQKEDDHGLTHKQVVESLNDYWEKRAEEEGVSVEVCKWNAAGKEESRLKIGK